MQLRRAAVAAALVVGLVAAGCSSSDSGSKDGGGGGGVGSGTIDAHGGTNQIWLRDKPNVALSLYDGDGKLVKTEVTDKKGTVTKVAKRTTDAEGAMVFRYIDAGKGYVVKRADDEDVTSKPVTVTSTTQHPKPSFYEKQTIEEGYGYLTTRDGTKLAIKVTLPGPAEKGPYPTVIEYSGYDPANPEPSLVTISKTLAGNLGFATVGINIRGSGCSGGSMQLWEDAQAMDGYDAVETIAAQPWVQDHKVGMVGISYPATAMLYAGATQPPSLSAIAPMASYDDGFRALLWPGGIQNKGFARSWVQERYDHAQPASEEWVKKRIDGGDKTCADNQRMRGQNLDLASLIDVMPYYPEQHDLGESFAPSTFVDKIEVPTYMVASWQDEQVGGHAPAMIPQFDGNKKAWFTLTNGYHTEGLAEPSVLQGWLEFLQLYVAKKVPDTTSLKGLYGAVAGEIIHDKERADKMPVPAENYTGMSYDEALAKFESRDRVRVLFDEGGSTKVDPGVPTAAYDKTFSAWPVPSTEATTWYLGAGGELTTTAPTAADDAKGTIDSYTSDPTVRPEVSLVKGEDSWSRLPKYDWQNPVLENSLSYVSPALTKDTTMIGTASADLWVRSSEADTDLQVTLTEIRPDGNETYVQSGWVRASKRKLDEKASTELAPILSQRKGDAADMPKGKFVPIRLEVYPFAHAFRKGSQIRIIISAPGGDRPVWSFVNLDGTQDNDIARSVGRPSAIVFPVIPDVTIDTPLPACPSLRGQPCRPYFSPPG